MPLRFEGHSLDLERRELMRGAEAVAIEPQVFDLLVHLIRHRDRVVSKDELVATVWAGRIVSDSTLASGINAARRAVADNGSAQRLIRTVPRRGVRFVGEVTEAGPGPASAPAGPPASAPRRGKATLAVLPLENLSGRPDQDYFADGISEDLITALSRNRAFQVVGRNPCFAFRGREDVVPVALALGADYLVTGSVRRSENRARVTIQLVDAADGRQLWTERFDVELEDVLALQDEVARHVAAQLDPELAIAEERRTSLKASSAFEAWDFFRMGTRAFHRSTAEGNREAQDLFRQAIARDPAHAQAVGYLAYAIVLEMVYFDAEPDPARLEEAVRLGQTAVEADDRDALVRFMYGRALLAHGDYGEAVEQLSVACELNAALAVVHCGLADSLAYQGRFAEAMPHFHRAIALSPHDPLRWAFLAYGALGHLLAGEFVDAARWAEAAIRVPRCHYWAHAHRVAALGLARGPRDAAPAVEALLRANPRFTQAFARRRLFFLKDPAQLALYLEGLRKAGVA